MKQLSVHEVARQLSALLAAGEPVEITRYNRPIARLQPYPTQMDAPLAVSPTIRPVSVTIPVGAQTHTVTTSTQTWAQRNPRQAGIDALLRNPKG